MAGAFSALAVGLAGFLAFTPVGRATALAATAAAAAGEGAVMGDKEYNDLEKRIAAGDGSMWDAVTATLGGALRDAGSTPMPMYNVGEGVMKSGREITLDEYDFMLKNGQPVPPDVALSKNVLAAVKADRRTVLQLESLVVEREAAAAETRSGWERATAAVNERMQRLPGEKETAGASGTAEPAKPASPRVFRIHSFRLDIGRASGGESWVHQPRQCP